MVLIPIDGWLSERSGGCLTRFVEERRISVACVNVINMLCSVFDGGERASTSRVGRSGCFIGCCPLYDGLSYLGSVAGAQKVGWVFAACNVR